MQLTKEESDILIGVLPHRKPFLFLDRISEADEKSMTGHFTFDAGLFIYEGHFPEYPITPGVILLECVGQLCCCQGFFLAAQKSIKELPSEGPKSSLMTSTAGEFLKPVFPGETIKIVSEIIYNRFGKLKADVKVYNEKEELVCKVIHSGLVKL